MVGETGFAPARAFAHEFLRLGRLLFRHSPKKLVRPERLARSRAKGAAVFKTARSAVPHTAAKWSRRPVERSGTAHQQVRGKRDRVFCTRAILKILE